LELPGVTVGNRADVHGGDDPMSLYFSASNKGYMSEARDKKMKLKRRLDEEKAIRVMRACRFRRYDEKR